jgi:hypothetical protein
MCDLLVVFCDQLGNNPQVAELVYEPDRGLQIQLNDFIQNYVFIMEEDGKLAGSSISCLFNMHSVVICTPVCPSTHFLSDITRDINEICY